MTFHNEIKSRLNSQNACYYSVQNVFCLPVLYQKLKIKVHKTVILPVVLYGCETWSLTLGEEHRVRIFENRVLRIFGPKREEDGSWRKLHNDELYSPYSSPKRWAAHAAHRGEGRGVNTVLGGRLEGKTKA
jgi:hypothetical protein